MMTTIIDKLIIGAASICLFMFYVTLSCFENKSIQKTILNEPEMILESIETTPTSSPTPTPTLTPIYAGRFEEEVSDEMNCLFYATKPLGRYYITGYNHEETGSKITASGKTCHEGTITTCAADVWGGYFKFGDYVEIMVDGQPRLYRIEDTGGKVKKRHIDIYFYDYSKMARFDSNYQNISRVEFPFGKPQD